MYSTFYRPRLLLAIALFAFLVSFFHPSSPFNKYSYTTSRSHKPNAVIFILLSPSRISEATVALLNIEDRFNRRLKYPYVLFTAENEVEVITEEVKAKVDWITEGRATFATVSEEAWEVPQFLDKARVDYSLENIGFSLGYRAMCRFYSGFFWQHPALAQYDWLWRLDTDIEFHCDVPYDPIERLVSQNALYGFVQINDDASWVQPSLASNVSHFLAQNSHIIPQNVNHGFAWGGSDGIEKALSGVAGSEEWTMKCMYNNFEISHRSVWESDIYTRFFNFLDQAGGFFYERWGDSPVHSFGLAMSLRKDQVVQFRDLGYQHQSWAYECPELARCACIKEGVAAHFDDQSDAWYNPGT